MPAVKSEVYDGVAVVSVEGDLTHEAAQQAASAGRAAFDRRRLADLVVDLSACTGVGGDGLEALLGVKSRCEEAGGRLKLAGADGAILKVLEMTRLRHRFDCCGDAEQALKLLRA